MRRSVKSSLQGCDTFSARLLTYFDSSIWRVATIVNFNFCHFTERNGSFQGQLSKQVIVYCYITKIQFDLQRPLAKVTNFFFC